MTRPLNARQDRFRHGFDHVGCGAAAASPGGAGDLAFAEKGQQRSPKVTIRHSPEPSRLRAGLSGAAARRARPIAGAQLGTNEDMRGQKKAGPPLIAHAPLDIAAASGPLAPSGPGPEAAENES